MIVVPFLPSHLKDLILHEYINFVQDVLSDPEYSEFLNNGMSYTALVDGKVICCAGFLKTGTSKLEAWALLSKDSGIHMLGILRAMLRELKNLEYKRIQTNVRCDFKQGIKFIEALGFKNETPNGMKDFGDDGHDYYLYARCA